MKISPSLLLVIIFIPLLSRANFQLSPFYVGTGINLDVLGNDKEESIGYEAMFGSHVSENLALEAGYADFRADDINKEKIDPIFGRVKAILPVSDYASLNLGVGIAHDDNDYAALIGVGTGYQLMNNWSFNINYQRLFGFDEEIRNLESLNISVIYRFGDAVLSSQYYDSPEIIEDKYDEEEQISNLIDSSGNEKLTTPLPSEKSKEPICHDIYQTYIINKGESLIYISNAIGVSFNKLKKLNKKFFEKGRIPNLIYPGELVVYPSLDCDSMP
ncbi:porin family protein [Vibrio coralliirubri]|uniref:porin family protein n=1 Tax=Vibrio coralliirubri TaxID=1516159 RepID=UPI00063A13BF|nr:porin family protein [Vibrio coralliirubri]CDT38766.1 conserved exported hypothetical protein [Vibrio coralliirubri]CDT78999.1 conserved exported hypothetical protein [Vibrio coralliirubri]CDT81949.1 conserved exported hypothetical protein [Vibrio coralliirubri]CDU13270.1 conserved exported hypothetical protein [Vibrio coralliirubri]